ncbi:MAG: sulfotransferase [Bacteroidota bacterium]
MPESYIHPSFFIIGERKCGTSSLYRYLVDHPNVLPCKWKEPQFFSKDSDYIEEHIEEYFQLFPLREANEDIEFVWPELNQQGILYHEDVRIKREKGLQYVSGEASANTFHEVDPAIVFRYLPNIKLIVLLRDPVARAHSHHRMFQRFREEGRAFAMDTGSFEADMEKEILKLREGKHSEFLSPGIYIRNLQKWGSVFPSSQIKVLFNHDLLTHPQAVMDTLLDWLEYPSYDYGPLLQKKFNQAPPARMPERIKYLLQDFYAPFDRELAAYLKRNLPWQE